MGASGTFEKLVHADVLRGLALGSFEHLGIRLDNAIQENRHMFVNNDARLGRVATFPNHVIVGSEDGKYFSARYAEDSDGNIKVSLPDQLDVPLVTRKNSDEFIHQEALGAVDAILFGDSNYKDKILSLATLGESIGPDQRPLTDQIIDSLNGSRPWKKLYREQFESISEQIKDVVESVKEDKLDPKYTPLYDGTVPEEKFESYRHSALTDLGIIAERFEQLHARAENAFWPFTETVSKLSRTAEDDQVLGQFQSFVDDYFNDVEGIRENIHEAMENEKCVMCLGQIYDALAESLSDYELASLFIERMSTQFIQAK